MFRIDYLGTNIILCASKTSEAGKLFKCCIESYENLLISFRTCSGQNCCLAGHRARNWYFARV